MSVKESVVHERSPADALAYPRRPPLHARIIRWNKAPDLVVIKEEPYIDARCLRSPTGKFIYYTRDEIVSSPSPCFCTSHPLLPSSAPPIVLPSRRYFSPDIVHPRERCTCGCMALVVTVGIGLNESRHTIVAHYARTALERRVTREVLLSRASYSSIILRKTESRA